MVALMGLRGKRAKSAEEHKLTGTARNKTLDARHESLTVNADDIRLPVPPYELSFNASTIWEDLVPKLVRAKMTCGLDSEVLADYCEAVARKRDLQSDLRENGYTIENCNNTFTTRPAVKQLELVEKQVLRFAEQLGLTPKARKAQNIVLKLDPPDDRKEKKASILSRRK